MLVNISTKYELNTFSFVLDDESFSKPSFVIASEFALDLFMKSNYVIVDRNFSTTEYKMMLMIILDFHKSVLILVYIFYLSQKT
jgi:hypothetical protein